MRVSFSKMFQRRGLARKAQSNGLPVSKLEAGQRGRVVATLGDEDEREHLRSLGLEPGVEVRVCRAGRPCVLGLGFACGGSCRIGVGARAADHILVECTCGHEDAASDT